MIKTAALTAEEPTVEIQLQNAPPVRANRERGPDPRARRRARLAPGLFRRLIERSSPVLEPVDPHGPAKWARSISYGTETSRRFLPAPRTVLVIRTDEVGDLAMTLPLLATLRAAWPQTRITLLARGGRGEMMRGGALVDEVISWPEQPGRGDSLLGQYRSWRLGRRLLHRTRPLRGRFDLAILPRREPEHFGVRYVACTAARRVIGFDPADRPGRLGEVDERDLITDLVCSGDPLVHALRHSERLARALGLSITPDAYDAPGLALIGPADHAAARTLLSPLASSSGPVIALSPGCPQARGVWSPASYAAAINAVHARLPVRVVLLGTAEDRPMTDQFVRALNPSVPLVSAVGRAWQREELALLAGSELCLGGFADAIQLASSVATPCVAVSAQPAGGNPAAAEAPSRIGPWSAGSRVVAPEGPAAGCTDECVADQAHCITGIKVEAVVRTVIEVLTGVTSEPGPRVPRQPSRQPGLANA